MYKPILTMILVAACAGCAHHRAHTVALAPNLNQIKMLPQPAVTSATLDAALPQFSHGAAPMLLKSGQPAFSIVQPLPEIQRLAHQPVLAMTEYRDWYWYATDVARDDSQNVKTFLSGYAVQKGGMLAWRF